MQIYRNNMLDNFSDKLALLWGGAGGAVIGMAGGYFADFAIKLGCTIIFAAVGAIVAFFMKRHLETKFNNKKRKEKTK